MLTLKAPMLQAYAGFKCVLFHMVFLMEPFWLKLGPKGPDVAWISLPSDLVQKQGARGRYSIGFQG